MEGIGGEALKADQKRKLVKETSAKGSSFRTVEEMFNMPNAALRRYCSGAMKHLPLFASGGALTLAGRRGAASRGLFSVSRGRSG